MRRSLRPWAAITISAVAVVGLTGAVRLAAAPPSAPPGAGTVSYEVAGAAGTAARIQYGDVVGQIYNPWPATLVASATLPWHATAPLAEPLSMHDLQALSPGTAITCTVRHDGRVVSTQTGIGLVFCDTPPG